MPPQFKPSALRPLARPTAAANATYVRKPFDPMSFLDPSTIAPSLVRSSSPAPDDVVGMGELHADIVGPGGALAARTLADWMDRPRTKGIGYEAVQEFVLGVNHSVLHSMTVSSVEAATRWGKEDIEGRHALGDVRKHEQIKEVEDFQTPWTFNYIGHLLLQRNGRLPTWSEFDAFLRGEGLALYYGPFRETFGIDRMHGRPLELRRWERALRWRVGKGYYSFLREADLLTRLRQEFGLPIRYHVLADALFRVDMWCGKVLVAVNIRNEVYKGDGAGRKKEPSDVMDSSGFAFLRLELDTDADFGMAKLVSEAEVARSAAEIAHAAGRLGADGR